MGEIKSVKVDNWGVFFLQKLQNFFNKTDYCDLTLQFKDNSQLKVHRLVLSACTDFFNVLEQTCEQIDDALVMPSELQADVVVPIVNFMYTGTLEFELKMYNKLLKTAREMNMTVLLKLLEAHKRTMESTRTGSQRAGSPKIKGKRIFSANSPSIGKLSSPSTVSSTPQLQRRMANASSATPPIRRFFTTKPTPGSNVFKQSNNTLLKAPKMQKGPTRFEAAESGSVADSYEPSFDAISYESKPMKEEPEEYEEMQMSPIKRRSSPFEQLRKGYNNNKRPAVTTFTSPPAKKPNIEDVKEFSEQQRMRKQIAAEYGDDAEYDGAMDDDIHNDDDDDEPSAISQQQKPQNRQNIQPQASIIIKQSPNEKPTIVVKDSSNSKMDHAKIISEVLRQYPHLVKTNKNIKLKIMPNVGGQPQKIIVKKESNDSSTESEQSKPAGVAQQQLLQISARSPRQLLKTVTTKPATSIKVEAQTPSAVGNLASSSTGPAPKRRIDSKTMHALIAQGAANTTGPWLCLRCGVNGRPISIPSYRGFRRHLINTHKETIDTALCEHCGWRSSNNEILSHHLLVEHKISSVQYQFPKCEHCAQICVNQTDLESHTEKVHPEENKQLCIYCNKTFSKEMLLYNHMKMYHRKIAREDGVIDFSEDEMGDFDEDIKDIVPQATSSSVDKKIKIISDISLPSTILKLEDIASASAEEDFGNDSGPKFVNADGNEMLLTAEQREEIMSQLEQDHDGGVVMVLNESTFPPVGESEIVEQDTKIETTETINEFNDHNIYTEFPQDVAGETEFGEHETSAEEHALDGNKDEQEDDEEATEEEEANATEEEAAHEERMDDDHMEWAENLLSAHDANNDEHEEEVEEHDDLERDDGNGKKTVTKDSDAKDDEDTVSSSSSKQPSESATKEGKKDDKKEDDISLKLKMLTGEWSDDEVEEEDDEEEPLEKIKEEMKKTDKEDLAETLSTVIETPSLADSDNKQKDTVNDSLNDSDPEPVKTTDDAEEEDETSQSAKSEKTKDEKSKSEEQNLEKKVPEKDFEKSDKSEEAVPEKDSSEAATKVEIKKVEKRKSSSESTKETKPRRTSAKEDVAKKLVIKEEETSSVEVATDEPSKATSPKNNEDEEPQPDDKSKKDKEIKTESNTDKDDSVTSKKGDTIKSVEKVKSLMSEWADDDDDI